MASLISSTVIRDRYTSEDFIQVLKDKDHDIRISMDGKGAWRDNVFVERPRRSVKYKEVCLDVYESVKEANDGIGK
jgi:putative transposase